MEVSKTKLDGVLLITPPTIFQDFRGTYVETYNERLYNEAGVKVKFVQDDISVSKRNMLRGIHGDAETWKLVSCLFGQFLLVPPKFGNGHLTLSELAIFQYKQSTYYDRARQFTILWNDPKLNIQWPIKDPILSRRDEGSEDDNK